MTVYYCINCNGLIFKEKEWVSIKYEDFDLNAERDERECVKCTINFYQALIRRNFDSSILKGDKRQVDIQKYCESFRSKGLGKKFTELTYLLYATGVLSFEPKENYALTKSGFFLNPTLNNQTLYFCDPEMATCFAITCFSCSLDEILIIKIDNCFFPNQNSLN